MALHLRRQKQGYAEHRRGDYPIQNIVVSLAGSHRDTPCFVISGTCLHLPLAAASNFNPRQKDVREDCRGGVVRLPNGCICGRRKATTLHYVFLPKEHKKASLDCQAKCNTLEIYSLGERKPRHLRGRLLISFRTAESCLSVTLLKFVPLGKKKRIRPLIFSLLPRCQGA